MHELRKFEKFLTSDGKMAERGLGVTKFSYLSVCARVCVFNGISERNNDYSDTPTSEGSEW